ncbi:MAG: alkaline phosphatase family protein [Thermoplasmata archaeon]|nr:alkaline phosphatase family protein [Thermoplasmata archaeon]
MPANSRRILVLGLDSVPPELLFERFLPKMPNLRALLARSARGTLRSCDPPITVPAWAVMFSGMDPGSLGIYGFRHRRPKTYWDTYSPNPQMVPYPLVWDLLSRAGKRVAIIGMPPGYPPPRVNGVYISDFLTPDGAKDFVHPASLAEEITQVSGGYEFDVTFRAEDRDRIGGELVEMTRRRWKVARHLWKKEKWDFFALHEIGPDRLHHTFWKFFDEKHPRYEKHPTFTQLVEDYYVLLDEEIGSFLREVPEDVTVMVLSDHGSQGMDGCFCINEWLIQAGYLKLKGPAPARGTALEKLTVDWSKTTAWGAGGYYARIFFNIKGREPQGILPPEKLGKTIDRMTEELNKVMRPDGKPLAPQVLSPSKIYKEVRGDAPDLMIYFGDLRWRSAGTLGYSGLFLEENDTGPDDSVHSFNGVFAVADPSKPTERTLPTQKITDIAPTVLKMMGMEIPPRMQGRAIDLLL